MAIPSMCYRIIAKFGVVNRGGHEPGVPKHIRFREFILWATSEYGDEGELFAMSLISSSADDGPKQVNNIEKVDSLMAESNSGNVSIGGANFGNAGHGNRQVVQGGIRAGSPGDSVLSIDDATVKFDAAVDRESGLEQGERDSAKKNSELLKTELKKPDDQRNPGLIKRTFNQLAAVVPQAAGEFFGSFTKAYFDK